MLIKWKINSSRWLWQSIVGESKNFWSITIPALFESSAERLITLPRNIVLIERFFRPPVESIPMHALYVWFTRQEKLIATFVIEFQFFLWHMYPAKWSDTFVDVSFRVIESISPRKFLASNSTVFSASLLCLEFWQIYWCHIILSPGSWFSIFFEVALVRYWKEPISHLAILTQPLPHWITLQSHCQNKLILFIQKDVK